MHVLGCWCCCCCCWNWFRNYMNAVTFMYLH